MEITKETFVEWLEKEGLKHHKWEKEEEGEYELECDWPASISIMDNEVELYCEDEYYRYRLDRGRQEGEGLMFQSIFCRDWKDISKKLSKKLITIETD